MKLLTTFSIAAFAISAHAIELNLTADFQDGTTQGWDGGVSPSPNQPTLMTDSGPLGAGDNALLVSAVGGGGAYSRWAVFNTTDWAGDWLTAGVTQVQADFRVVTPTIGSLFLRTGFMSPANDRLASTDAQVLPADGAWHKLTFDVTDAGLTGVGGADVNTVLSDVFQFRFLQNPSFSFQGEPVMAQIVIDNITALPEPTTALLLASAAVLLLRRR